MTVTVVGEDGTVTVTDAALQQIVVRAAETVPGARVRRRRHLEVEVTEPGARVQVTLAVAYGRVLPEVARAVQERVADALRSMCGLRVDAVEVAIEELE